MHCLDTRYIHLYYDLWCMVLNIEVLLCNSWWMLEIYRGMVGIIFRWLFVNILCVWQSWDSRYICKKNNKAIDGRSCLLVGFSGTFIENAYLLFLFHFTNGHNSCFFVLFSFYIIMCLSITIVIPPHIDSTADSDFSFSLYS